MISNTFTSLDVIMNRVKRDEVLGVGGSLKFNLVYRSAIIVWMAVKFLTQVYFFHLTHRIWDEQTRKKWNALLKKQAIEYRKKSVKLGGILIKVGQFLSTRTDFMPDVFIEELTGLVDQVPPMPFEYARSLLEKEWGTSISKHLKSIDEKSIASASIGEVYKGTLTDGSEVAIKVQRYRIDEIFHKDFTALKIVFWILSVFTSFGKKADLDSLYLELVQVMDKELDFEQELHYGNYFKERYVDNKAIHIPAYYESMCTKKVLVMDWVEGAKITDFSYIRKHHIDVELLAKTLFDFYLDQFLNQGYFHADPHAGNIIVQKNGIVSIIDFGMVSDIRKQDTYYFKKLIQGFIIDDYNKIIDTLDEMDFILPHANKTKLIKMIKQTVDMYENGSFKNMDTQMMNQLKEDIRIFVKEQPIQISADYAYLGRAVSIIFGILLRLYPDIDIEKWAKPKIKNWFSGKKFTDSIYTEIAKDAAKPLLSFPGAMLKWLENGERDRQWDKEKQQKKWMHHFYILLEGFVFILLLTGVGITVSVTSLSITAGLLTGVLLLIFIMVLTKHYRFIK